jgi:restriction system protein
VKHWKGQKAAREDVAALRGILSPDREIGLFVASGGFSADAFREAMRGAPHIRCMDLDQLIDSYVENYQRLEARDRERIPLRNIYMFAPDEV